MAFGSRPLSGYLSARYAQSLAEFGTPFHLPRSEGWILKRKIPGTPYCDAMGCYPLFACGDWSKLEADFNELNTTIVSLTLVADPFGNHTLQVLHGLFDVVMPYKEHYVADLTLPLDQIVSKSHRKTARRALKDVRVELCQNPELLAAEWVDLYAWLIKKHSITGMRAFSPKALSAQLEIPGMVSFRAISMGTTVGLDSWYVQGDVAYGHLAAFNQLGYEVSASYALKWHLIQYFAGKVRWLHLGAGPGPEQTGQEDGLTKFKKGWATGTRIAYLCGRVFDQEKYAELVKMEKVCDTTYFPAYRNGELIKKAVFNEKLSRA